MYKYVNANSFPIYLPCDRGGQVSFRPGEGTTKQWFARFQGAGQLTRTTVGDPPKPKKEVQQTPEPQKGVVIENIGDLAVALAKVLQQQGTPTKEIIREVLVTGAGKGADASDDFTSSRSLEQLADAQVTQRTDKKSNIADNPGNEVETKRSNDESQKTVDLLTGLDT